MDKFKIINSSGVEKEVDGIFYLFNSKYFFAYTEKEIDENGYVIFHLVQVGKEIKNTTDGPIDTGYMVGMEISNSDEWKVVQSSITKIVDDKKNNTQSEEIQYLPQNMLSPLKIVSTKTFRLAKNVVEQALKLNVDYQLLIDSQGSQNSVELANTLPTLPTPENQLAPIIETQNSPLEIVDVSAESGDANQLNIADITNQLQGNDFESNNNQINQQTEISDNSNVSNQNDIIIDYRARFFEEQEKNKQLEEQIRILNDKIENIKSLIV